VKALGVELNSLEEEEAKLSELYPQSTDPDTAWAFTVRTRAVPVVVARSPPVSRS
jgi:hypothetical protein